MFKIDSDKTIHITRGDIGSISIGAKIEGTDYEFQQGDVIRFKVFKSKDCKCVEIKKDVVVDTAGTSVSVNLDGYETKIGEVVNKPTDYWYEVELNPETAPQTIIGYDEEGAKIFRLYPEGSGVNE
jgi:hypothetical protein